MSKLKILSIGRNNLKKIEKLEDVASTLEQLWISYNQISSLEGIACCKKLTTLYMSNNAIKSFSELDHLVSLINVHGKQFLRHIHFILIAIMIVTISKRLGLRN